MKTCAGYPQSWKAWCHHSNYWYLWCGKLLAAMGSAPATAYPAWAALLWGARAVSCLQTSMSQKRWFFLIPAERCDGVWTDLHLFPHLIYPASHAGPVTLGPNLLPTPIPLTVFFSNELLSLCNSCCYFFLVFPLLLSCTSLFFLSFTYTFFFHVAGTQQEILKDMVKWIW